jgi:hypothetical protein
VKATKANGGPPTTNPESKNCNIHMNSYTYLNRFKM